MINIPILEELNGNYNIINFVEIKDLKEFKNSSQKIKQEEKYYNEVILPKIKKEEFEFIREIEQSNTEDIIKIKSDKKEELTKIYLGIIEHLEKITWKGLPTWFIDASKEINQPDKILRQIKKLQIDIDFLEGKKSINENKITPNDIIRAKDYPFKNLIELKRGFAKCPFHNEHTPSFYVKNNFGYCFSCGKSVDTIQFLIETRNVSFVEAINLLK